MATDNPFSPTFGVPPPVLAGRDEVLDDISDALETGPSHPDFTSLLIGARGSGKTVTLNAIADSAESLGWFTLSDNASPKGLIDRLTRAIGSLLTGLQNGEPKRRVTGLNAVGIGIDLEPAPIPEFPSSLREVLSELGELLLERRTGLLITIDELHSGDLDEIREFGSVLQLAARTRPKPVAFVGAGIPAIESTLLSGAKATFLQRCARHDIDRLDPQATRTALVEPIRQRGASIDPTALENAVRTTRGYAFMVQLVGFHSWKAATNPTTGITATDVVTGIHEAERRIGRLVLAPIWQDLSDVDRKFLLAMAVDDGESKVAEIANRLEVDLQYTSVYRKRLISAGLVFPTGRGRIDFAHQPTRDWLRNNPEYLDNVDSP